MAKEILGFTRPSEGAEGTDVSSIVESVSYVVDHEARRRGIGIDRSSVGKRESSRGTPATWQTVVFNLVLNAVHHAPASSTVRLRLHRKNGRLVFECENGGVRIPVDIVASLFDPFVSRATDGTGLGLALVDRRVRELGGSIEIVNEPNHIVFRVQV